MNLISYFFSVKNLRNAANLDGYVDQLGPSKLDPVRNPADLDSKVSEAGDKLVVLAILVDWCPYCQRISPTVEDIAARNEIAVILVDGESIKANIKEWKYGVGEVTSAPTFIFMKGGAKIEILDTSDSEQLRKTVARLVKKK